MLQPIAADTGGLALRKAEEGAPDAKSALIDSTTEAEYLGVCGVPSFVIRDEVYWGPDRLSMIGYTLNQRR